jgi:hypothetical protein
VISSSKDFDQRRETRSREQVLQVLSRVGVQHARADQLLSGIEFPASLPEIYGHLGKYGIDLDSLTDKMGGSS